MSDVQATRDHARAMADARHTGDCPSQRPAQIRQGRGVVTVVITACTSCVSDAERVLWRQIADELDRYLNEALGEQRDGPEGQDEGLWS